MNKPKWTPNPHGNPCTPTASVNCCSVHKAAPDLYEALDDAPEAPAVASEVSDFIRAYRNWYANQRRAALAKARGEV